MYLLPYLFYEWYMCGTIYMYTHNNRYSYTSCRMCCCIVLVTLTMVHTSGVLYILLYVLLYFSHLPGLLQQFSWIHDYLFHDTKYKQRYSRHKACEHIWLHIWLYIVCLLMHLMCILHIIVLTSCIVMISAPSRIHMTYRYS